MKILLAPFGSRGDVHPMIALAERLDREGHESLIAGPRIIWRLLNDAGCFIIGTATLSKVSSSRQGRTMPAARGAPTTLNRAIEIASAHEFAELPMLAQ